ncbi:TetR/AcrR family transcriptional regulator [Pseudoflavonifractor sp. 60]|uniref:TetR/AcrR family transcriptional regulator n=1 Tax=Pseudoflavonifractor sp. 60 TaxID=2304576 RepID=UPI00136A2CCD|nr:TetR/AcrR family transcriptional regulator [Pseudoflavonifractor sp. 60]
MDRRTIYTRNTVKDALLELLEEQPFEKITVAALCRQAEITRATFYLHFTDINAVLDELLDEALMVAEAASNNMEISVRMDGLKEVVHSGDWKKLRTNERLLGPCQRVADDPKYQAIFQDATLSNYVIRRIYTVERDQMIPYLMRECHLGRDEADKLFMMIVYGLFYVNRSLKWSKDDNWYKMQFMINCFMFGGFDTLRNQQKNNGGALSSTHSASLHPGAQRI